MRFPTPTLLRPRKAITSVLVLIPFAVSLHAGQVEQIRFDRVSIEDGLSQSTVLSIVQDHHGFMWFATMDGLNKFDGYTFTVFRHDPLDSNSIAALGVRRLFVDKEGRLWIVTFNGKLDRYDPVRGVFVHYRLSPDEGVEAPETRVYAICEDPSGALWIGIGKGWLYRFESDRDRFVRQEIRFNEGLALNNIQLQVLLPDGEGGLWLGTQLGLMKYHLRSEALEVFPLTEEHPRSVHGPAVSALAVDDRGDLWIGTSNGGVFLRNRKTGRIVRFRHDDRATESLGSNRVVSLLIDSRSNLWIGTADAGLDLREPQKQDFHHYRSDPGAPWTISGGEVMSICEDGSGGLWFGTSSGGVNRFYHRSQQFSQIVHHANDPGSLSSNDVWTLCVDHNGTLWVGTDGGGLNRCVVGQARFEHYLQSPGAFGSNSITAVYEDRRGTVWIGTDAGIHTAGSVLTFDESTRSCRLFTKVKLEVGGVAAFYEGSYGDVWIGTLADGARCYDRARETVTTYRHDVQNTQGIGGNSVLAFFEDRHGYLWVGTQGTGVSRFDRARRTFTSFRNDPADSTSLSNNTVWCFNEDSAGVLWMGTWGGGLNRFQESSQSFRRFTVADGLPSNIVNAIQPDKAGNIWISTNRGLCKFNTRTFACKNYNDTDGLSGDEFSNGASSAGSDGRLYFGGNNGITVFHPDSIVDNPHVPPIALTRFSVFGKPWLPDSSFGLIREITLSYQQNFFSFEFAALDYTAPEKNQYAYMLEGIDRDWVFSGSRRYASYTNIAPGEYVFRVKGSNNDGVWNPQAATVALVITPPWWQTWWFKLIALFSLVAAVLGVHRYRVNRLLEVERTRNRIARDLHDEVSGTVTGIVYFSDAIAKEIGTRSSPSLQKLLSLINESATDVQEAMSDIIWSVSPENDRWETIFPRFRRYASDLCETKGIRYKIDIPSSHGGNSVAMESRRNLWLVYKEMVTNAVKHSGCTEISIGIEINDRVFRLLVVDNGKGFDPTRPSDRHGIKNIQARTAALNGEVRLTTAPNRGTRWELCVPL